MTVTLVDDDDPPPPYTVSIEGVEEGVNEGEAAEFTVRASSAAPSGGLAVRLSVAEAGGGSDFVASGNEGAKSVTIAQGQTTASYSVATVQDTTDEPNGRVTVTVQSSTATPTAYGVGSPSSASVAVNDDDAGPGPGPGPGLGPGPAPPNAPPVFPSGATAQTAAVGAAFSYAVPAASDPDGDTLTYAATLADGSALPGWLTFTASTRTFSGTPGAGDAPAEFSVRVTATDGGSPALSATATFTLTVEAVNAPPAFPSATLPAQTAVEDTAFGYTVPAASDPDDDSLTYTANLAGGGALPGWLTFTASTRTFSGMPRADDAPAGLSVRVTATDHRIPPLSGSTTFALTVADLRPALLRVAVRGALAAVARRSLTSALENIGARLAASAPASGLTLAGRAVPLEGTGLAAADGTGGCVAGGFGERHGFAAGSGNAACGGWRSRGVEAGELLRTSAFSLKLGAPGAAPSAPLWSVWGRGDLGSFEGRPESGSRYRGELRTGWLGMDARAGRWVAGLAVSHGAGEADYRFDADGGPSERGRLETALSALYPYARWTFAGGLELRGVLGAGTGAARHRTDGDAAREKSDLRMYMTSLGLRRELPALAGIDFAVRGDTSLSRLETDSGPQSIDHLTADSYRARLGLEASRRLALAGEASLTPFVEAAVRRDGGDGVTGTGVEVAGGVRYAAPGVRLEARGRWLAAHSEDGAEERGVSVSARVGPGAQGRGLSLTLAPRWGVGAGSALWGEEMPRPAGAGERGAAAVDARIGYGVGLAEGGVLTPFAEAVLAGGGDRRLRLGARFEAKRMELGAELSGERSGGAEHALRLRLDLRF